MTDAPLPSPPPQGGVSISGDTRKATNPKDAIGSRKARWFSFIPLQALVGPGLALLEGALKYGKFNYRPFGVRVSVYVDAAVTGHLMPFMEGQDIDPDSGLHHVDKAIASLLVLRDSMLNGNHVDDRPPRVANQNFLAEANKRAEELLAKYPNPVAPYTQVSHPSNFGRRRDRRDRTDPSGDRMRTDPVSRGALSQMPRPVGIPTRRWTRCDALQCLRSPLCRRGGCD
jgi:hypothetical protein